MKSIKSCLLGFALLAVAGNLNAAVETQTSGRIDFGKLPAAASGKQYVEVHIRSNLVSMVARLAERAEPTVAEALRGLQQIHVNVVGLGDDNRVEVTKRIDAIRKQLEKQDWECLVNVKESKNNVNVYMKTRGDESVLGLAIIILDENEQAVLVNIVGDIRPDKLSMIAEKFGIDPLKQVSEELKKH